jgi:hypothetical protein
MRPLPTLFLVLFGAWELVCWSDNVQLLTGQHRRFSAWTWPATWQMFTRKATWQESLTFEGRYGTEWVRLPMEEWLPSRWESGWRWEAAGQKQEMRPFLVYACEASGAAEVRVVRHLWKRRLGSADQSERDPRVDVRGAHRCRP